jgi:hypothetical protein
MHVRQFKIHHSKFRIEAAHIAQLVEHTLGKGEVIGSIPIVGFGLIIGN